MAQWYGSGEAQGGYEGGRTSFCCFHVWTSSLILASFKHVGIGTLDGDLSIKFLVKSMVRESHSECWPLTMSKFHPRPSWIGRYIYWNLLHKVLSKHFLGDVVVPTVADLWSAHAHCTGQVAWLTLSPLFFRGYIQRLDLRRIRRRKKLWLCRQYPAKLISKCEDSAQLDNLFFNSLLSSLGQGPCHVQIRSRGQVHVSFVNVTLVCDGKFNVILTNLNPNSKSQGPRHVQIRSRGQAQVRFVNVTLVSDDTNTHHSNTQWWYCQCNTGLWWKTDLSCTQYLVCHSPTIHPTSKWLQTITVWLLAMSHWPQHSRWPPGWHTVSIRGSSPWLEGLHDWNWNLRSLHPDDGQMMITMTGTKGHQDDDLKLCKWI